MPKYTDHFSKKAFPFNRLEGGSDSKGHLNCMESLDLRRWAWQVHTEHLNGTIDILNQVKTHFLTQIDLLGESRLVTCREEDDGSGRTRSCFCLQPCPRLPCNQKILRFFLPIETNFWPILTIFDHFLTNFYHFFSILIRKKTELVKKGGEGVSVFLLKVKKTVFYASPDWVCIREPFKISFTWREVPP